MAETDAKKVDKPRPSSLERAKLSYRALQWHIRPRETLKRIRRYSFFVMFMKGALPAAALGLGIAVLMYALQPRDTNRIAITFENMGKVENDLAMINPRLTGTDDNGYPFIVTAATAVQESRGSDRVRLEDVTADISLRETNLHVTAARGVVDTKTHVLDVSGGIRLTSEDGYDARTPAAIADLKAGTVHGESGIQAKSKFGQIEAQRFALNRATRQLKFDGNVHMVLNGASPKK